MKRQPHSSRTTSSENIGVPGGDASAMRDNHDLGQVAGSGHASTTLRYYTHVIPATERIASDRLAERLLGAGTDGSR